MGGGVGGMGVGWLRRVISQRLREVREGGDPTSENHPMGDKDRVLQVCGSPLGQR